MDEVTMDEVTEDSLDHDRRDDVCGDDVRWDDDLDRLRSELDARAERDERRWADQRRAIRLRLEEESAASRSGPRTWLRPVWAAPVLAAGLLLAALLFVPGRGPGPQPLPTPTPNAATESAGELLRSVEATLAADPAASLAPAGLLVAELEQRYAALQDGETDG